MSTATSVLRTTILLFAVLALAPSALADPFKLSAEPVPLDETNPARNSVGKLIWRGGLELKRGNADFKELSALLVSGDGMRLTSVTDQGYWVTMDLVYDQAGHLSNVKRVEIGALHGLKGEDLTKKQERDWDAETLARLPDGSLAVAFERDHRILRYPAGLNAKPTERLDPPQFKKLKRGSNDGVEALVTLDNGKLLAFVEGSNDVTVSPAYLQHDGGWKDLSYQHDKGFRPTGATRLPDGDVLVIERCFKLCNKKTRIRLRRLEAQSIVPDARLEGEEIAELKAPFTVDNLEGVAVRRAASGETLRNETLVYLLSDDNGNKPPIQRTLLLMFALTD